MMNVWTPEVVARLRSLVADGRSARQIAADLGGVTRNAVIGKVHRLGLAFKQPVGGISKPAASMSDALTRRIVAKVEIAAKSAASPAPDLGRLGICFMDLKSNTCRRPLWDDISRPSFEQMRFCGAETEIGSPYCPACRAILYTPYARLKVAA